MRKLLILVAVLFALSVLLTAVSAATKSGTSSAKSFYGKSTSSTAKYGMGAAKTHKVIKHVRAKRTARCKVVRHHRVVKTHKAVSARTARGPKWVCHRVKRFVRKARPAAIARGPIVNVPAPVVNVPQQPAPVVNVPSQPAPVVNVPPFPPTVGITVDNCNIYIVQNNQLMVLDKNTFALKQTVPLTGTAPPPTGAGPTMPSAQPSY